MTGKTQTVTLRLVADGDQLIGEIKTTRQQLGGLGADGQRAGQQADRGFSQGRRGAQQFRGEIETLKRQAGALVAAFAGLQALRGAVSLADQYTNLQNRIRTVTETQQEQLDVTEQLIRVSQQTRSSFAATTEVYARTALSAKELNASQQDLIDFTRTLNQAAVLSGASAQESSAAMIQLSQGLASGQLRGEELRSVLEQLPVVADVIAKQMGATRGELLKFGEQGEISAQIVLDAFRNAREEINDRFLETVPTLSQAMGQLRTGLTTYIGITDQSAGATSGLAEFIGDLGGVLVNVALDARDGVDDLSAANDDLVDWSDTMLLIVATTADGLRLAFKSITTLLEGAGLNIGARAAQIGALVTGDFSRIVEIEKLLRADFIQLGKELVGPDISRFRDALSDLRKDADGLSGALGGGGGTGGRSGGGATGAAADLAAELALLNRQIELMSGGADAATAALQAKIEAATGTERAILQARLQIAQMRDDAKGSAEPLASISEEMRTLNSQRIESLFDSAFVANLSEVEQQTIQLQRRATDLRELYARTGDNRFLEELEDVEAKMGSLGDTAGKMTDEIRRVFETRFGGGLSDELLGTLQGIEELRTALGGIDAPFTGAIDRMLQGLQQFSAAGEAAADRQFGMYAAGIGQMLSGVQGLAQEGSAAYKVLGTASAAAAVASVAAAPWPANLALIPAMIGLMQSLGFGVGGGGFSGGALDTGNASGLRTRGTVLGDPDAASDSIENAIDRLAGIATEELRYSSQMAASLRNIETALAGVTAEFARFAGFSGVQEIRLSGSIGDLTAIAGTRNDDIFDQIQRILAGDFEASESAAGAVSTDLTAGIQQILDGMGSGIAAAVGALGGDVENALDIFTNIEIPDLQFTEKDNLDEALQQFFSSIGDSAVEIVSQQTGLAIGDLEIFGEGALETLTRVASGVEFASNVAAELDVQLASLADVAAGTEDIGAALIRLSVAQANAGTGIAELVEQYVGSADETADYARDLLDLRDTMRLLGDDTADVTREMLNAAGGLDRLQDGLETYREQFFSADEQLAFLRTELSNELAELGLSLPRTRDAVRDLIESARGNDGLYGALIALTPEFDRLFDAQEDVAQSADDAARAQRQLAESIQATTRSLAQEIARLRNESVAALQIGNVLDAIGGATDPQSLVNAAGSIQAALTQQLQEQLDAINAQSDALDAQNQQQIDALNAQIDAVNEQIRAAEQLRDVAQGIRDYVTGLGFSDLGGGTPAQQLAAAQATFEAQAQAALSGDIDAARGLTQIADQALRLNADVNASGPAAAAIREAITSRLSQVADAIDVTTPELQALNSQLAVLEQQRTVLEQIRNNQPTQVADINSVASKEAEALRQETANQLESVQSILGLLGDLTLLSRDEQVAATRILQDALATVIRGGDLDTVAGLDDVREAINEASAGIVSGDEAITRIFENGFDSLAGAFGDGIVDLASDISGLSENLTRATLQNAGDIANAIDHANAAAIAQAEIHASAILSPLRLLGIETGNMRSQLVEQFRRQILEQQLTSQLTGIIGAETRDVQSLVSAAAQIISGNVSASGRDVVSQLFGLQNLESLTRSDIVAWLRGIRDTESSSGQTLAQILGIDNSIAGSTGATAGNTRRINDEVRSAGRTQVDWLRFVAEGLYHDGDDVAHWTRRVESTLHSGLWYSGQEIGWHIDRLRATMAGRSYATGTSYFSGGYRIVGENGPELEATGPSRIFTAAQTRDILSPRVMASGGSSNDAAIVAELRASNAELRRQTRELHATVRVLQGGLKRVIAQGDEQLRNSSEMARAARLETAS